MSGEQHVPNPLWGGRFKRGASSLLVEINTSVQFDQRLALHDIEGSIAHLRMLAEQAIVSSSDAAAIESGLRIIEKEIRAGDFHFDPRLEDVHMNIESRLHVLIGPVAGRLHTGRSRNDQVAVDSKMWVRQAIEEVDRQLKALTEALICRALEYASDPMPGFTHLQCAQPVTIGHHLLAYAEMLFRDRDRFLSAHQRAQESPLGAAALSGTSYAINPWATATRLGFSAPMRNSMDAVSDRDFMLDFLAAASTLAIHLSRFAEELIIWTTPQFGYIAIPEELSAGSSIMPQKRNPDAAELVRAKAGRVVGDLVSLLIVMKGLPLAYSRDMQEDKESIFDAADTVQLCTRTMSAIVEGMVFFPERTRRDATTGNSLATDIADWLVIERGMSFREAHHLVGSVVRNLEAEGYGLDDVDVARLTVLNPLFDGLPPDMLTVDDSVARRTSYGGTAPSNVRQAAAALRTLNGDLVTPNTRQSASDRKKDK